MGCCIGRKVLPNPTNRCVPGSRRIGHQRGSDNTIKCRQVRVNTFVDQKYTIFSSIGKGEFGHVVRVEHKETKIPYAIKIIDLTQDIKANPQMELKILETVKHRYVIRLYEVIKTSCRLYLVMDLATGGELMDRICLLGNFDECDATRVLFMILNGLWYLHSIGITHRDLKPQNILYYHPGADSKIIITDFGLSAMRDGSRSPANYLMKTDCGTIEYMAPEVITRALYTNAVDMWSMGVIAYIVLSGRLPFPLNGNIFSTLRMICFCKYNFEGEPWSDISDEAKDFISSLLVYDPSKRLTVSGALEHKWIKNKQHNKLNLQMSISSNWSDSCVSLKNEKGLKRHTRTKDSTNPYTFSGNSAKKSHDDKLHRKGSHGKTRASDGDKVSQRDASTTNADSRNDFENICAANGNSTSTNCCESGEMDRNVVFKSAEGKPTCVKTQSTDEKMKKRLRTGAKLSAIDSSRKEREPLTSLNSTNVKRKPSKQYRSKVSPAMVEQPNAQDCNGNLAFVKRVPSSTRHVESRADDTMSSRWNLEDLSKDEGHVTERSPLSRAKVNNRATLLPPIKSCKK